MKIKKIKLTLIPLILALFLTGCVSIPNIQENRIVKNKEIKIENQYRLSEIQPSKIVAQEWWKSLNDEQLNNLMNIVLTNNDDMKIALLNIEKTKINVDLANTAQTPSLSLDGYAQRQKLSEAGLTPPPYAGATINFAQVALSSSYEFDLFGKYDSLIKEQDLKLQALSLKKDSVILMISNQVVKQYGYWQFLKLQEENFQNQLSIEKENLELQKKKKELGIGIIQNILSEENIVKNLEIQYKINQQNLKQTENNIQTLSGTFDFNKLNKNTEILNYVLPDIDSISSDAVTNRPDVAYYLTMVESQRYHLNSLKADFYPSISLTGAIGLQKVDFSNFLSTKNWFGNIGPSIHIPILDSGKIKGNYKIAGIDTNLFIAQYNQAIIKSFYDINTQLYNYKNSREVLYQQSLVFENQNKDFELNKKQWELGNISKLNWNTYQQKQKQEQLQYLNNQFTYFNAQIDLINSVGGVVENNK